MKQPHALRLAARVAPAHAPSWSDVEKVEAWQPRRSVLFSPSHESPAVDDFHFDGSSSLSDSRFVIVCRQHNRLGFGLRAQRSASTRTL
jgi:hypothetical protein